MNEGKTLPDMDRCFKIMEEYHMLPNIIDHSVQVMNVALALTDNLIHPETINRDLVISSALLHDIAKTRTINSGEMRHDLIGGELLRDMGYDTIAEIVESHVVFQGFVEDGRLEEREIIFYADKRVMHDRVVSIDHRVEDLVERYGINEKIAAMIQDNKNFVLMVENKIRRALACDIDTALINSNLI